MSYGTLPKIDLASIDLSAEERQIAERILNKGELRASKPTIRPIGKHQCLPVTADFDLPENDYHKRRALAKELDKLVDKIVAAVPKSQWHGIRRWSRAFGAA
jgi:hypothetical protein